MPACAGMSFQCCPCTFIMKFENALVPATLVKRYKRFLADVIMQDGRSLTVHTPNTGSMLGVSDPGSRIWLRDTRDPQRKYRFSWEMSETQHGVLVGVHTGLVNSLVEEAIRNGVVRELQGYAQISREVRYGVERSRIDLLLSDPAQGYCYVEIKNVTAVDASAQAMFPDAVTTRGQKHLRELSAMVKAGHRAVIFFCIQRNDVCGFRPADEIDPDYGALLRAAQAQGVLVLAYKANVTPQQITLTEPVPVRI